MPSMQVLRTSIKRWAWLVSFTILFAALMPSLSQAMVARKGVTYAEICTATGSKVVVIDATDAADFADGAPGFKRSSMDCPYCAIHHGAPALPPAALQWAPPDALSFERPRLFFVAPRTLFVWASSLARGPPHAA